MNRAGTSSRRGVAIVWLLIVLGLLTAVMANITRQHWNNRRALQQRHKHLQAEWLARGGLELAAARLLTNPTGYDGDSVEPLAGGQIKIAVSVEAADASTYRVTSVSRYRTDEPWPAAHEVTGRFRRITTADRVRLERTGP